MTSYSRSIPQALRSLLIGTLCVATGFVLSVIAIATGYSFVPENPLKLSVLTLAMLLAIPAIIHLTVESPRWPKQHESRTFSKSRLIVTTAVICFFTVVALPEIDEAFGDFMNTLQSYSLSNLLEGTLSQQSLPVR